MFPWFPLGSHHPAASCRHDTKSSTWCCRPTGQGPSAWPTAIGGKRQKRRSTDSDWTSNWLEKLQSCKILQEIHGFCWEIRWHHSCYSQIQKGVLVLQLGWRKLQVSNGSKWEHRGWVCELHQSIGFTNQKCSAWGNPWWSQQNDGHPPTITVRVL